MYTKMQQYKMYLTRVGILAGLGFVLELIDFFIRKYLANKAVPSNIQFQTALTSNSLRHGHVTTTSRSARH